MTTAEKLNTIHSACSEIKQAIIDKGQNPTTLSTFASAIGSISGGTTPTGTLSITANGTYDVTNYASADVSVSGGGSPLPVYSHPELKSKNCYLLNNGTVIPMTFNTVSINGGFYSHISMLKTDLGFIFITYPYDDNPQLWNIISASTPQNVVVKNASWGSSDTLSKDDIVHISFNFDNLPVSTVSQFYASTFEGFSSLESISISNMANLKLLGSVFNSCSNLDEVDVSSITTMCSGALAGSAGTGGFLRGTAVKTLSFYSLNSTSFGSATNQFNNMLAQTNGVTVHFPSNLQSVIGSWSSVTSGFGGSNTTVLFDLPATY